MLRHFFCPQCQAVQPPLGLHQRCPACGSVLVAGYDYAVVKRKLGPGDLPARARTIWRYQELLPVVDEANIVSLGEGLSPVLALRRLDGGVNASHLFMKDDSVLPLGSFRCRLASVCVSKAREEMAATLTARAGQHEAFALAAYAARAGIGAVLAVRREELTEPFERGILSTGATLFSYECGDAEADALVGESAAARGWFNATAFYHPYRLEGAKSVGLEIAEIFEWKPPEVIVVPALGGTVLAGIYRAMRDLAALGWIRNRMPRLVAVQPEERAHLVEAWEAKELSVPIREEGGGIGFGETVEFRSQSGYLALDALYKSFGRACAVGRNDLQCARLQLARQEGLICSAAGAAALAAALKLDAEGWIRRGERVLLYNPEGCLISDGPVLSGAKSKPLGKGLLDL